MNEFIRSLASIFDLFPKPTQLPSNTDAEAIRSDWEAVGEDMKKAGLR